MRRQVIVFFAWLLLACVPAQAAQAPEAQPASALGIIVGIVMDPSGAVIPGVEVNALDAAGQAFTTTTDDKGEFRFEKLALGTYKIVATAPGFKDFLKENVAVASETPTRVDFTMVPASAAEKVEVTAGGAAQVEQETAQLAGSLTNREVTTYALNGRNFTQLVALAPGVSNQTGQDEALVGIKGSVNYSVNGGRVEYNTYDIDGGDILNASINGSHSTLIVYPSVDAISDLQVLTSNYGAMYGRSASGTILASTKSGTNQYHGDAYFFLRNNHLNARNFFDQTSHAPLYQKYEPGGTIGGPVYIPGIYTRKDKTFFFFSEEYRHDREPLEFNQAVPSAQERNCKQAPNNLPINNQPNPNANAFCMNPTGNFVPPTAAGFGDFSDACPSVANSSGNTDPGGTTTFTRIPGGTSSSGGALPFFPDCPGLPTQGTGAFVTFPGNLVPIDARSNAILNTNIIPLPNSNTGCNSSIHSCYDTVVSPLTTWLQTLFRIDHNITPTQKVYVRYIHDAWATDVPYVQWGFVHNSFPTVENHFVGPGNSAIAHYTATIRNRLVNDIAMAFTTDHITLTDFAGPGVTGGTLARPALLNNPACINAPTCGMGYIFGSSNNFGNKMPGIIIGGNNEAYGGNGFAIDSGYVPWHHSNPTYSPRDDASFAWRNHTIQFGVLAIIAQRNEVNPPVGANTGDIQGLATFSNVNSFGSSGNAFADFLGSSVGQGGQPRIQSFTQDSTQAVYHNNYHIIEPYAQDNWKITKRLTLNLGVRFSLFGLYQEKFQQSFNWVPPQFSSSVANSVSVDTQSGMLLNASGKPIPINLGAPGQELLNGVVQCGISVYTNGNKVPPGCMTNQFVNAAPRIGFAFDPFGDGKTSVRAGYGIFYEHGTGNEANTGSLEGSPGAISAGGVLNMTQYYPGVGSGGWGCIGNQANANEPGACGVLPANGAYPLNVTSIPTAVKWPYVQQWSFSIQRELPGNFLGSVAYVGSKGTHLTTELQVNQLVPMNQANNPFTPGQPITQGLCSDGITSGQFFVNGNFYGPGTTPYQNLLASCIGEAPESPSANSVRVPGYVIAPGMGQIFSLQNIANSTYNAFQLSLRRTKGPFTLGLSYTYSHSIDDSSDRTSQVFIDAYDISQNRAASDFDQRHLANISYIYELPLIPIFEALNFADSDPTNQVAGHGLSEHAKTFLKGWELAGITTVQSGTPFSVINGGSASGVSTQDNAGVLAVIGPGSYPDLATSHTKITQTNYAGLFGPLLGNPSVFTAPQGLTYGDAGRNFFRNPGRINFDMSISKNVIVHEGQTLQFRIETFNVFNHTQFRIYDPTNPGNPGNNIVNCYGSSTTNYSAGDPTCLASSSFLHPVDAHRARTMQLGVKYLF